METKGRTGAVKLFCGHQIVKKQWGKSQASHSIWDNQIPRITHESLGQLTGFVHDPIRLCQNACFHEENHHATSCSRN